MALTILGLSGALSHDPSAALYIDGKLIAAVEEERFVRDKHAKNRMPYESAKFCLDFAGIKPADVGVVAIPFAPISLFGKARWHYAKRYWYAPDRGLDAILMGNRRFKRYKKRIEWCLTQLGFDLKKVKQLDHFWDLMRKEPTPQLSEPGHGSIVQPRLIAMRYPVLKDGKLVAVVSFFVRTGAFLDAVGLGDAKGYRITCRGVLAEEDGKLGDSPKSVTVSLPANEWRIEYVK